MLTLEEGYRQLVVKILLVLQQFNPQTHSVKCISYYRLGQRKKEDQRQNGIVTLAHSPGFAVALHAGSVYAVASCPVLYTPFAASNAFKTVVSRIEWKEKQEKRRRRRWRSAASPRETIRQRPTIRCSDETIHVHLEWLVENVTRQIKEDFGQHSLEFLSWRKNRYCWIEWKRVSRKIGLNLWTSQPVLVPFEILSFLLSFST